jgi:hypothetical protein
VCDVLDERAPSFGIDDTPSLVDTVLEEAEEGLPG